MQCLLTLWCFKSVFIFVSTMTITEDIYEMLYVSTLEPTAQVSAISVIATRSRVSNALRCITGMLIFDGIRFCQYLEGSKNDVLNLFERIRDDSRHAAVTLIHEGPSHTRRFNNFSLAFANGDDFEVLGRIAELKGENGVTAFSQLLPTLDTHV